MKKPKESFLSDALRAITLEPGLMRGQECQVMCVAADRLEVLEREHQEFFERWHDERRKREALQLKFVDLDTEHDSLVLLAVELRELLFDSASDTMQGAMVGSPVDCLVFAKWWIQRAKGLALFVDEKKVFRT